jgi:hypothetical protein
MKAPKFSLGREAVGKKRPSFLKKRSKRLLFSSNFQDRGHGLDPAAGAGIKVFWFFSSEKNIFLTMVGRLPAPGRPA